MNMLMRLSCKACGDRTQVIVPAEQCESNPDSVYVSMEDPQILTWADSHHMPFSSMVAVVR